MYRVQLLVREHLRQLYVGEVTEIIIAKYISGSYVVISEGCEYSKNTAMRSNPGGVLWTELGGIATQNTSFGLDGLCKPLEPMELLKNYGELFVPTRTSFRIVRGTPIVGIINKKSRNLERWFPCSIQFARLISMLKAGSVPETKRRLAGKLVFGSKPDLYYAVALRILMGDEDTFTSADAEKARHPAHGAYYPITAGPDPPKRRVDWTGLSIGMSGTDFLAIINQLLDQLERRSLGVEPQLTDS